MYWGYALILSSVNLTEKKKCLENAGLDYIRERILWTGKSGLWYQKDLDSKPNSFAN